MSETSQRPGDDPPFRQSVSPSNRETVSQTLGVGVCDGVLWTEITGKTVGSSGGGDRKQEQKRLETVTYGTSRLGEGTGPRVEEDKTF